MHDEPGVVVDLVLQEPRRGELRLALHDADALGEPGEEQPFLERGVAATDDEKLVGAAIERAVAGRAEMHARTDEIVLTGNAEAPVRRSGGDEGGVRLDLLAARQAQAHVPGLRPLGGDALDAHGAEQLDLVATRLGDESLGQISAADAVGEPRVVVDALGDAGLAAEPAALDDHRVDALSRRVDRRREPGGAAADDREVVAGALGLEGETELARQLLIGGLDEDVGAVEDDRRDRPPALLQLLDVPQPVGVLVDVDPVVRDALLGEESLRALAVRTPRRAVDRDLRHEVSCVRSPPTPASGADEPVDDVARARR